jgi:hypothetical protein
MNVLRAVWTVNGLPMSDTKKVGAEKPFSKESRLIAYFFNLFRVDVCMGTIRDFLNLLSHIVKIHSVKSTCSDLIDTASLIRSPVTDINPNRV